MSTNPSSTFMSVCKASMRRGGREHAGIGLRRMTRLPLTFKGRICCGLDAKDTIADRDRSCGG